MNTDSYGFTTRLWRWTGSGSGNWYFIGTDAPTAEALTATEIMTRLENGRGRGFGSVRVTVRIGASEWQTSAFPSKDDGWMIPVKAAVRRAEGLSEGQDVQVTLQF